MKKILSLALALFLATFFAKSALALTPNHSYTVELMTVSTSGQQTSVAQMDATADATGKLNFQFSNVPDANTGPFLMIQIMDTVDGQQQAVRQTLVPAPTAGQHLQMGVNEVSSRQTQVALQAMQAAAGDQALRAMFPILVVPTGAISANDVNSFGQMSGSAVTAFHDYLTQNGVTGGQLSDFQSGMLDAMRDFAAANKTAVDQADLGNAAGLYGRAGSQFLAAMMQAGATAGIDPLLMSAAFDEAGRSINHSPALNSLPTGEIDAMQASFLADAQQRQLLAQMINYTDAMPVVGSNANQNQTFTNARNTLQDAMFQARQNFFQQAFLDPTILDQTAIDQALNTMQTAMQNAFDTFDQETTATTTQINDMLGIMAGGMNGMGGMGGGMMSGTTLTQMGFGMMQTSLDGTTQNWSTMMVAAGNLIPGVPGFAYTPDTNNLTAQLAAENVPTAPDWSLIPDGPYKSMLQLQYDLMLVRLIDAQTMAGLTQPPTQDDLAAISATDLANRTAIRQNMQGLNATQIDALMAALSPTQLV